MKLPVDISEVFRIAKDMQAVKSEPISVSVIIDDSASGELAGIVRAAFASAHARTRVTVTYLEAGYHPGAERDDFAVIVAGTSGRVGELASEVRAAGVPAMIVALDEAEVLRIADTSGFPIPPADVVTPVPLKGRVLEQIGRAIPFVSVHVRPVAEEVQADVQQDTQEGPQTEGMQQDTTQVLLQRMGEWIITTCASKRLALAYAFAFVRKPLANDAITATCMQNAAVGLVPVLPGADMPIMTLNQMKMVLQIATAYGQPLDADRIKELACVLGGAFLARNLARAGAKLVPFAGWLISGAVGYAATAAMGRAAVDYFEAGGDLVGIAQVVQSARDGVVASAAKASQSPLGKRVLANAADLLPKLSKLVGSSGANTPGSGK